MVEAEQGRAVGDAAAHGDLSRSFQRPLKRQRADAVAVAGHPLALATAAAKDLPAQFALAFPAGKLRVAISEVEPRPDDPRLACFAVAAAVPFRVAGERLDRRAAKRDVVEPDFR